MTAAPTAATYFTFYQSPEAWQDPFLTAQQPTHLGHFPLDPPLRFAPLYSMVHKDSMI